MVVAGARRGATTDADGFYVIISVEPGDYTLTASLIGYGKQSKQKVRVKVLEIDLERKRISLSMRAAAQSER